jgi:arsenical pump membrane protein
MMLLAEFANGEGVFAWAAMRAVAFAGSSRTRLFALVYAAGMVTTALLSNDATIVVLTPAVIDALRRYDAPVYPYVVVCALVANAASFILPISNPSNLLVFAGNIPGLGDWLLTFVLPSTVALAVTFGVAWIAFRRDLAGPAAPKDGGNASMPAPIALIVLALAAAAIVTTSARGGPLGAATFTCGCAAWLVATARDRARFAGMPRAVAWPVVALTAALFVILAAVDGAGGFAATQRVLAACAAFAAPWNALATGGLVAVASNLVNNLPVGLNLGQTLPAMHAPFGLRAAALIGVNLGPNATVNGSLATLLWLTIVRRAGIATSPWAFARVGIATTVPALVAALLTIGVR